MDDLTRYVLIALAVLVVWFGAGVCLGWVVHRYAKHARRVLGRPRDETPV